MPGGGPTLLGAGVQAAATRLHGPVSHPASRLAVSILASHLHCLSFSALIGFLVLTHTPGPVFDPGDGFSCSLGLQLPSSSGAAGGGGGEDGDGNYPSCSRLSRGGGSPPRSQEAAGGRAGWGVGTVRLRYGKRIFPLWASSFPFRIRDCGGCGMLVSKTWTFESLDKWDIDFFSFLLLDAPSPSICLHWLGLQRRYQELTLNGPHPAEPRGGSRAGEGLQNDRSLLPLED